MTEKINGTATSSEATDAMRRVLRGMVTLLANQRDDDKITAMLDGMDDARLALLAQESLTNIKRSKTAYDAVEGELVNMRKEIERIRAEFKDGERALQQATKAIGERDDLAAKLRDLQKQLDPEANQLKIMYAIDEATAKLKEESSALRRELGQRKTEVEELRVSKRRMREAIDRLAGKD